MTDASPPAPDDWPGPPWPWRLQKLVFLGAPLERGGHWVDILLGLSPYTAPFARLG